MSYPEDYANDLARSQKTLGSTEMARLILAMQKSIEVPEDDTITNNVFISPHIDRHNTTIILSDDLTMSENRQVNHIGTKMLQKRISLPFHSDPLTYNTNNADDVTFHQPDQSIGTKFGGAGVSSGTDYIVIPNNPYLTFPNGITVAVWAYFKPGSTNRTIFEQLDATFKFLTLRFRSNDKISAIFTTLTSVISLETIPITTEGWRHIVVVCSPSFYRLYVDNTLITTSTESSYFPTSLGDVGIFGLHDGSQLMQNGEALAWLSVIHGIVDDSWVNNDFNGLRDLTGLDEVICFPFVDSLKPQPPFTSGLFVSTPPIPADWWDTNYLFRIPITINPTQFLTPQANFPVLINSVFPELIGRTIDEIKFVLPDKTQLPHQIDEFDSLTGKLVAHTSKPLIDNNDLIYLYYNNPEAVNDQTTAVWDSNYLARYAMTDPVGGEIKDSTIYAQHLTHFNSTTEPGKVGKAHRYLPVTTNYAIKNPTTNMPTTNFDIEFWAKSSQSGQSILSYATLAGGNSTLLIQDQDTLKLWIDGSAKDLLVPFNDNLFHHIVVQWQSSSGIVNVFLDSVLVHQTPGFKTGETIPSGGSLVIAQGQDSIGGSFDPTEPWDGLLDEIKISNILRSSVWISATYKNENDPSSFYTIGPQEPLYSKS